MKGSVSGYVARIQACPEQGLVIVTITGLTGDGTDGEHPFIQNVRFEQHRRNLTEGLSVGEFIFADVLLTYAQWKSPRGEARAQNFMMGQTLFRMEPEAVVSVGGYTCALHCTNEVRLRVRLVRAPEFRVQGGKRVCEARVACTVDAQAHYYTLTAWHGLADALASGQKGDTLMATVKARKEKWVDASGEHWRDNIEIRSLCRSPAALQTGGLSRAGD